MTFPSRPASGASLVDLLVALAIVAVITSLALPLAARSIDASRARQAAAWLAGEFRRARQQAVLRSASVAVVFDESGTEWTIRLCADGNGNGVRRADLTRGTDACFDGPTGMAALFPSVSIAVDATLPSPDGGPGKDDPVQLGNSNLASFSPSGTASSGTVFIRSAGGEQYAVRVAGATGRTRLMRYDVASGRWVDV